MTPEYSFFSAPPIAMTARIGAAMTGADQGLRHIGGLARRDVGDNPPLIFIRPDIEDRDAALTQHGTQRRSRALGAATLGIARRFHLGRIDRTQPHARREALPRCEMNARDKGVAVERAQGVDAV